MQKENFLNGIYPISPTKYDSDYVYLDLIKKALKTNIKIFQFRGKHLSLRRKRNLIPKINEQCSKYDVKLIINDDVELLKYAEGCGLHIGDDKDLIKIRESCGGKLVIGVSCYNSLDKAKWAEKNGANYVSFGPCFPSQIKKNTKECEHSIIGKAKKFLHIPVCAIGGINKKNIVQLLKYKPDMLGIISGIFDQPDISSTTNYFVDKLKNYDEI
ncbi:MAG: thiamine phosphate synthase [Pseudomonadota bacterium]|nr:thiamine phosphate synthase [Pseudomonadota bacterium]